MSAFAERLRRCLERHLSPVTAKSAMDWACARAGLSPMRLRPDDLAELAPVLSRSLGMYLNAGEASEALQEVRDLSRRDSVAAAATRDHTFPILTEDDVVAARTVAMQLARDLGFDHVDAVKIATVTSELCRNIHQYAGSGALQVKAVSRPQIGVAIVARDNGPGIPNLDEVLTGRYRSRTGMGLGLKGSQRLMDEFEVETAPGRGTVVRATRYVTE